MPLDDLPDRIERKAREYASRPEVRVGGVALILGAVVGEIADGDLLEKLHVKETSEVQRFREAASRIARIPGWTSGSLALGGSLLTGSPVAAAGAVGFGIGVGASALHKKLDRVREKAFLGPEEAEDRGTVEDRATRAWRVQKIDVPDDQPIEFKYHALGDLMNRLAVEGSHVSLVKEKAREATSGADTVQDKAVAIGQWILDNVHYLHDEEMEYATLDSQVVPEANGTLEIFQTPDRTIESGYGDCDCMSILFHAMARASGFWSFWRLISQVDGKNYHHVYNVVPLPNGTELPIDTVPVKTPAGYRWHPLGWEGRYVGKMDVYPQKLSAGS